MKSSANYLIEPLLTQFFLIDAICTGYLDEARRRHIFTELSQVFCVPENEETEQYYLTANSPVYKKITDHTAYERLCRTIEFAQSAGQDIGLTPIDRVILAQKREAMQIRSKLFPKVKNLTLDMIADTLLNTAMNGNVDAMVTLAFMEYHGICICKDVKNAVKRISLCAGWNHLFGNLMGIAYDGKNQEDYYQTLYTILRSASQREVFQSICQFKGYENSCVKKPVARILERAFGLGIVQRDLYDQIFAKVAFSQLLSTEDKEKLLLNKKKDAIVSLSEIPFDATRGKPLSFDREKAALLPLNREQELHKLLCSIYPAVDHRPRLYRTLLAAGNDDYLSQMYAAALKRGFAEENDVIEVDAGMLTVQDFVGAKENFILRGLSETKNTHTVFLISHCDELGERELDELMKLLDYDYRRRFKLLEPTVCLDISDVMFVLLASEKNDTVKKLAQECDLVSVAPISQEEKQTVIDGMVKARAKLFGIDGITLEAEGKTYLTPFKTEQIIRMIDGALKRAAYDHETVITAQSLRTVSEQQNISSRRQFGYLGGAYYEKH